MRQREDHELSVEARRELEALDHALAGEPVDAEFDAVARLARDMRSVRPEPTAEFAARLDERAAGEFPPQQGSPSGFAIRVREWLEGARPMRLLAPAGAVATVLIVASVAVIQSGGGDDASRPAETTATTAAPGDPGRQSEEDFAPPESAAGGAAAPTLEGAADGVAPNQDRKVEQSATLTLSTDGDEFESVADGVVDVTDQYDGFVLSSEESSSGDTSRAVFDLELPSEDLSDALA